MFTTLDADRAAIERKYHNPDEPFNPFSRMAYHGEGYDSETGLSDEEILAGLKTLAEEDADKPHPIARANAIRYVLEHERLYVNEHDYFVGLYSLNRLAGTTTMRKWMAQSEQLRNHELVALSGRFNRSGAVSIWTDYDHVVPDWSSLMRLGFPGILERARNYREEHRKNGTLTAEREAFFAGIEIEYTAILDLLDRLERHARTKTHAKAAKIAECLHRLKVGEPTDIYEAMQLIHLYFLVSESVDSYQVRSLGNGLDATLYPFYCKDLESGRYTREQIRELLGYFLLQWSAIGNYWGQPLYLGGTDANGESKYNELSWDILDVQDTLGLYNPKIQIKVNRNTPDRFLNKVLDMIRCGHSGFVFCCEPGMIQAVMGYGATYDEAREMDIRGCYETGVRANEVCPSSGYVNAAKAVEYVFTNGFDRGIGEQVGIRTGALSEFTTFEAFYAAFLKQWTHLIRKSFEITDDAERFLSFVNPSSLYSGTIEGSLQKGADAYHRGVKYNNSAMLNCGFASTVDSLMGVKEFVYDKNEVTLAELAEALEKNWAGYEHLRAKIRNSTHKYGNGDEETDRYAAALASFFAGTVNNTPNGRGGVNKAVMHSARMFIDQGAKTFATPDGRKAGEELSKNASPSVGMDKNGVTALLSSVLKLKPSDYRESFCLDVMLHPSAVQGGEGLAVMKALLMHYLENGGMSLQFNIFNADTLRDAQRNPEKYKNLQVRVCGWNVLWNNMSKKEQDAYILRAEAVQV